MAIEPGTTLGRYQILGELGHGGMASVYKAFQPALERTVALKVLRPAYAHDTEFLERFRREALAIARLRHPHIVQVHDFDAVGDLVFLVMEHIEGGTLKHKLREERGLPWAEIARLVREVAEALAHAHAQGIVHRDVKPSNVMLTKEGRAVVTDFGIAKILAAAKQTETGVGIGTPEYMSPEQGQSGTVDHRTDVYSLGVLAYEALTGRVPFTADTPLGVMLAHVREPLPLPSKVDTRIGPRLEQVLLRALAKDPAARYQGAIDFAQALEAAVAAGEQGSTVPTRQASAPRAAAGAAGDARPLLTGVPRPVLAAVGAAAILFVAGAGAGVAALMGGGRGAPADGAAAASASLATGTNVTASLAAIAGQKPATITFAVVSSPGEITVRPVASGPLLPLGVTLATGAYYEINTTAKFDRATLCFEDANVTARSRLLHYTANTWNDRTTSTEPPRICGEFTSFSPVAIVEVSVGVVPRQTASPAGAPQQAGPAATLAVTSAAPTPANAPATSAPTSAIALTTLAPAATLPISVVTPAPATAPTIAAVTPAPTIAPTPAPTAAPGQLLVAGRVTSAATGAGIAGVWVRLFVVTTPCCPNTIATRTDASGTYSLSAAPGRYRILFEPQPASSYVARWWSDALSLGRATEIVLSGGDRSGVDVALPAGQLVTGRVVDATTGAALSDIQVVVNESPVYENALVTSPSVSADGSFAIRLVSGTYQLKYRIDFGRDNTDRSVHTVVVADSTVDVGVIRVAR